MEPTAHAAGSVLQAFAQGSAMTPLPTPYCGTAPVPAELLARWNLDPVLIIGLLAATALVMRCGRPASRSSVFAGLSLCVLLFVSPLCAMTSALFSARVAHHVILTAAVAPMLAAAVPRAGSLAGCAIVHVLVFWLWHAPAVYGAALSSDALFWLMQISLLGSAICFWTSLRQAAPPAAIFALAAMMAQMGLLGALITFAAVPLYAPHWGATVGWGMSPLEDQQLAGLIMWIPASFVYLAAMLLIVWRSLGRGAEGTGRETNGWAAGCG